MFAHIARGYDRFDHVASMGNDLFWRPRALWSLDRFRHGRSSPSRVLDVGCGTGDLSRQAARHFPTGRIVGIDVTPEMLDRAEARTLRHREGGRIDFGAATALRLPFRSASFDLVMSAFVVRNLPNLPNALRELRRVTADGGTLLTLEITEPTSPRFRALFHAYFDTVVPWLGGIVGSEGPYRYLPESLRSLPGRGEMARMMRESGFPRVATYPQSFGIVTTFLAEAGTPDDGTASGPARGAPANG